VVPCQGYHTPHVVLTDEYRTMVEKLFDFVIEITMNGDVAYCVQVP